MSKIANMATYRSTRELKAMAHRILSRDEKIIDDLVAKQVAKQRKTPITTQREYRLGMAQCIVAGFLLLASMAALGVHLYLLTGGGV